MKDFSDFHPKVTPSTFSLNSIQSYDSDFFYADKLSILFIESGYGTAKINNEVFDFTAPSVICINETEHLHLKKSSLLKGKILTFSPSTVREYFTFENLRNFDHCFTPDDIGIVIYLSIFFQRFPQYIGYLPISKDYQMQLDGQLKQLLVADPSQVSTILIDMVSSIKKLLQANMSISNIIIQETAFEVKDVLLYLHNHCKEKITIPKLSKQFHVNRTTLSDRFFEATGETIITYLNKYRINLATILLRESTYSIANIAEEVGFNDTAYFAKLFKKYMLHTPSGYRQRYVLLCQAHKTDDELEQTFIS